jgi:hypothetical protein
MLLAMAQADRAASPGILPTSSETRESSRGQESIMRMLLSVHIPHEPFNELVRDGTVGEIIQKILDVTKPEQVWFTEQHGTRGAILILDVASPSKIPALAEPWFLKFNADCEFRIVMSPDELAKAELDRIGKAWT